MRCCVVLCCVLVLVLLCYRVVAAINQVKWHPKNIPDMVVERGLEDMVSSSVNVVACAVSWT